MRGILLLVAVIALQAMVLPASSATLEASGSAERRVYLDELDLANATSGDQMDWGRAKRRGARFTAADVRPKRNRNVFGEPLSINSNRFERGVGVLGNSLIVVETGRRAKRFRATVGADTATLETWRWGADCRFTVWADDRVVFKSRFIGPREREQIDADVSGASRVYLQCYYSETHEYTPIDWCDAYFTVDGDAALKVVPPPKSRQLGILTPKENAKPRINGPKLFGVRPNHPILYTLPVTGERPMKLSVVGLPEGASFDAEKGFLRGAVSRPGTYRLVFTAENAKGSVQRDFRLVVGDRIALTPPMCWNSWNCFARTIDDGKIRGVIDAFVESGLVNHGWSYVNLDDFWMQYPPDRGGWYTDDIKGTGRDAMGNFLSNQRFPDMKALADYAHSRGMKLGLYSSPGPFTCGGCYGSWGHERQDAATFAKWGIDFLKYDYCTYSKVAPYGKDVENAFFKNCMVAYPLMGGALAAQDRDIVFDICQYGGACVPAWGARANGQMWRTTGDIMDIWGSCENIIDAQVPITRFVRPGAWNDPDMMIVGDLGWGRGLRPSRLTPNEQYTHVGLWAMFAAPLQIGCDIAGMNEFTRSLLTNDEILEINQDELGRSADCVINESAYQIWHKPLSDGSVAIAVFNRFYEEREIRFLVNRFGIVDGWRVRSVWAQKDIGFTKGWEWKAKVPAHATVILRFYPPDILFGDGEEIRSDDCPYCPRRRKT